MSPLLIVSVLMAYFVALYGVSYVTSRKADNAAFFKANNNASWLLVAFGMIGTSLSGVTFVSVPGTVSVAGFQYLVLALGFFLGYFVVAFVLLPLYYKLNLTSIYTYLDQRFGSPAYELGASYFILSRTFGASLRLFLVVNVLQMLVMDALGIPFTLTAFVVLLMILAYTFKGGVKTIVWTDTLQTFFMLSALVVCVAYLVHQLGGISAAIDQVSAMKTTDGKLDVFYVFNTDFLHKKFFLKQLIGGAFITIAMTGLDQEMMQKNISVSNLRDSQRNMMLFSLIMVIVVALFLFLGAMLYTYMQDLSLPTAYVKDEIFPSIAMHHAPAILGLLFVIGLVSALFPSADGAITALTASFCIDLLRMNKSERTEAEKLKLRQRVHLSFTLVFFLIVIYFKFLNEKSIVELLMDLAGYTYGPLLGLFAFGILTKRKLASAKVYVVMVCLAAPVVTYLLATHSAQWLGGYEMGTEGLLVNGLITFVGLYLISSKESNL